MTTFGTRHAHTTATFAIKVSNPAYVSLPDLFNTYGTDKVYPFYSVYINRKGQYGPQACLALSETQVVNLPQHLLEDAEKMINSAEDVDAINSGLAGFKIYQYTTKAGRVGYSVDWVDVDPKAVDADKLPF